MKPTDILKHEHKIALAVLDGAEREARNIQSTGAVDTEKIGKMVDFFRTFLDKCHHSKEERHLFVALQEHGLPAEGGPIAVMLHEHTLGRAEVAAIAGALEQYSGGDSNAAVALAAHLLSYVDLLHSHIDKENNVLFEMADRLLPPQEQAALCRAFDALEAEEMGEGVHEQYHQFAHDLMEH